MSNVAIIIIKIIGEGEGMRHVIPELEAIINQVGVETDSIDQKVEDQPTKKK